MKLSLSNLFILLVIVTPTLDYLYSSEIPNNQLITSEKTSNFTLKRVIISNTSAKLSNLTFGSTTGKILIQDVAPLNEKSFSELMQSFWDKPITQQLLDNLTALYPLIPQLDVYANLMLSAVEAAAVFVYLILMVLEYRVPESKTPVDPNGPNGIIQE